LGVVLGMAPARGLALAGLVQQLEAVLAHRLENEPARLRLANHALVDEARPDERRQRLPAGPANRGGALARESPGEDGEAREELLFVEWEQAVAPIDRRAQRALARGHVARALAGELERARHLLEQLARGIVARSRRREL